MPTVSATLAPTDTAAPTLAPSNTLQPAASTTIMVTETPSTTALIAQSATAIPTETMAATVAPLPSATPLPTNTLMPTNTPDPTETPAPEPTEQSSLWLMGFENSADTGTWYIVNDTVMGGVSTAQGFVNDSVLTFNGDLSLENNGGFTSIRRDLTNDLTGYTGIQMRVRGDGRSYYLRLSDVTSGGETSHEQLFATRANEWTTIAIPFDQLIANFRGFEIDRPPIDPSRLRTISIMLRAKDAGWFQLEIDWIQAYK